ncbi:MAG: hypothetical protein WD096_11215 [Actinomycetota bacterium]
MTPTRKALTIVSTAALAFTAMTTAALAQARLDPTVEIEKNTGGWIFGMAILITIAAAGFIVFLVVMYTRYAPRFARDDNAKVVHADRVLPGQEPPRRAVDLSHAVPIVAQPPALPSAVAAVAVAAPPAIAAPVADATAAPPAAAPVVPAPAAETPAPATAPPPAPAERVEVSMDQEVFDAKLAELLAQGTDRRVAEGQARRAAMIAARKKATGEG